MQELLTHAAAAGQADGEITNQASASARFLLCSIEGMGVLGKTGRTRREMREIVDVAMLALDVPGNA